MSNSEYYKCEGATIPLTNWQVEHCESSGEWVLCHYVGGEDYETFGDWYPTRTQARRVARYLNMTMPPQGYTHYWYGE